MADHELMPAVPDGLPAGERAEPGCVEFRPHRDATDPGVFYPYEVYADTDAFRTHLGTGHLARFLIGAGQHSTTDACRRGAGRPRRSPRCSNRAR